MTIDRGWHLDDFVTSGNIEIFYPGSKTARPELNETVRQQREAEIERAEWDKNPIMKSMKGTAVPMYTVGHLATALGRSVQSIRLWETRGYIPAAPYRRQPTLTKSGEEQAGRRYYRKEMIESAIQIFTDHGLMGKGRIDWQNHTQVTIDLVRSWRQIIEDNQ